MNVTTATIIILIRHAFAQSGSKDTVFRPRTYQFGSCLL